MSALPYIARITEQDRERGVVRLWDEHVKQMREAYLDAARRNPQATILLKVEVREL